MAVYVPLSDEAQSEARELMASNKNLLKPQSGEPIVNPSQDIILGCFWMTKMVPGELGEGMTFSSPNQAITTYDFGAVSFRAKIQVMGSEKEKYAKFGGKPFETTIGRIMFNTVLPDDFPYINEEITKKRMSALVDDLILKHGIDGTPDILDKIKNFGYRYATRSGTTFGMDSIRVPEGKPALVASARKEEEEIIGQYNEGLLSQDEKYQKVIEIWERTKKEVEKLIPETLGKAGSVFDMVTSGARGSVGQVTQMAGMKGLIINTVG
jgi:DNA-directed RNA polymerase subunit beta'